MHSYPRNSPEAAARIVALVLIADGHVSRSEVEALQRLGIERELGLSPGAFAQVVHTLCEDLLMGAYATGTMMCSVDPATLALLLAEVDDPELQGTVLRLASAATEADQHLAETEAQIISTAQKQWRVKDSLDLKRTETSSPQPA